MRYRVEFSQRAVSQIESIYAYVRAHAGDQVAQRFATDIVDYCKGLAIFPRRGTRRDDLYPGVRTIGFRRRVTIAIEVSDDLVIIVGIFYGGQDIEAALSGRRSLD